MAWIKKHNIIIWAISLIAAVALWAYVSIVLNPPATRTVSGIAVVFEDEEHLESRNLMLVDGREQTVTATFTGNFLEMQQLDVDALKVVVSLAGIRSWGTLHLPCELTGAPDTLEVQYNSTVTVEIAEVGELDVPIHLELGAEIAEGHMRRTEIFEPSMISVRGPRDILSMVDRAVVTYVSSTPLDTTIELDMSFTFHDNTGDILHTDDLLLLEYAPTVFMTIPITFTKELPVGLTFVDGGGITGDNIEAVFSHNTIMISGEADVLAELEHLALGVVDLASLAADTVKRYPVVLPDGVTNETGVSEIEVALNILGVTSYTMTIGETNMTILAGTQPEGYRVDRVTQFIDVTVRGPDEVVSRITQSDIRVVLDLSGIPHTAGTHSIDPGISIDGHPGAGVVATGDTAVTIRLIPVEGGP